MIALKYVELDTYSTTFKGRLTISIRRWMVATSDESLIKQERGKYTTMTAVCELFSFHGRSTF